MQFKQDYGKDFCTVDSGTTAGHNAAAPSDDDHPPSPSFDDSRSHWLHTVERRGHLLRARGILP